MKNKQVTRVVCPHCGRGSMSHPSEKPYLINPLKGEYCKGCRQYIKPFAEMVENAFGDRARAYPEYVPPQANEPSATGGEQNGPTPTWTQFKRSPYRYIFPNIGKELRIQRDVADIVLKITVEPRKER